MKAKTLVIPKPDYITWEEITTLLHAAFKERLEEGLNYQACTQSTEDTKKRADGGVCLVAMKEEKLVGTLTLHFLERKRKIVGYFSQIGVHPKYKGCGIGHLLVEESLSICKSKGIGTIYSNTSEKAKKVIEWHLKQGYEKYRMLSYPHTNYYSIEFVYHLGGVKT